jgi:multidrug efflux pump subunit AcrA (membrane-fusion protein)
MSLYDGRKPLARLLQLSRQVTKQELVVTLVLLSTALFTSSCSSVSGASSPANSSQGSQSNVRVQVSPTSAQISPGASLQFTATISGTSSVGVIRGDDIEYRIIYGADLCCTGNRYRGQYRQLRGQGIGHRYIRRLGQTCDCLDVAANQPDRRSV